MKRFLMGAVVAACTTAAALHAQGGTQAPPSTTKPDPKSETKPAPSIAGKWDVSAETAQGTMASTLNLKVDGKKVTGTMASQMGESPLEGEFADGALKFSITIQTNNGGATVSFVGTLKENGTLAGTLDYGQGAMAWTATRPKGL